jgi:hypothetical protein
MSRRLIIAAAVAATAAIGTVIAPAAAAGNVAWSVSIGGPGFAVAAGQPGWGPGFVGATVNGCGFNCGLAFRPVAPAPVFAAPRMIAAPAWVVIPAPVPRVVRVVRPAPFAAPVMVAPVATPVVRRHGPRPVFVTAPVVATWGRW